MKYLLLVLLAASLAANLMLARRAALSASPSPSATGAAGTSDPAISSSAPETSPATGNAGATAHQGTAKPGSSVAGMGISGAVWRAPASEKDLHRVVADLRAAGYPAPIIRAVVNQLLNEHFASRSPTANLPFWKQGAPSPETVAAQAALGNERLALYEALLGPDARASAALDGAQRERRYGSLPDAKIDAIAKIERDYQEMTAEAYAKRRGNLVVNSETMAQTQQLMEQEKMADMAAVLSPEELAEYEMRNSISARRLINNLRQVEVTETEFAQLYQAQKSFDTAHPMRSSSEPSAYSQRQTAQLALNEQARSILGEDRFYSYLEGTDFNYANVAKNLAPYPTVTAAAKYGVYRLQVELQSAMNQSSRTGPPTPEKTAELRATVEAANTRLEALLGAEAADAYRKQGAGRMFGSLRSAPAPAR